MATKTNCTKNGKKYYRTTYTVGKDKNGKTIRKEFYGKSKKEAEAKKFDYITGLNSTVELDISLDTLGEIMEFWLFNVVKFTRADNTLQRYLSVYRHYIHSSPIAELRLDKVTNIIIQRMYTQLHSEGKTVSMLKNLNKVLKVFFNYCVKQRYIPYKPCNGVDLPKDNTARDLSKKVDPFTDEERELIIASASGYMKTLLSFAFSTGLREGELLGLKLEDIDLIAKTVTVSKSLKLTYNYTNLTEHQLVTYLGSPKTDSSVRVVPIPEKLIPTLKQHMAEQRMRFRRYSVPRDEQLLFTTTLGTYINPRNMTRSWKRLLDREGIRYRKFHNIRHTYATKLFELNVDIKIIQKLLGHSSLATTSEIYVHISEDVKADAIARLNESINF